MLKFILRRLLFTLPLLLVISVVAFGLMNMAPGNALDELRARKDIPESVILKIERDYGYRNAAGEPNPWPVRYAYWLNAVSPVKYVNAEGQFTWRLQFGEPSLGTSVAYRIPVAELLWQRVPATLRLALCAILFTYLVAIPLGVLAAVKKDGWADRLCALLAYASLSLPGFFLAMMAMKLAAATGWFPTGGSSAIQSIEFGPLHRATDIAWHLVLPTVVLGLGGVAGLMRVMRASMLDYLRAEFVTTARAKGVPEGRVMFLHVLRNAINPLVTSLGFAFADLLSGAVIVEKVMNYPGLGKLTLESFLRRDEYVVMAAVLLGCVMLVVGNLLADLLLAATDPRIRLEKAAPAAAARRRGANWATAMAFALVAAAGCGVYLLPWNAEDPGAMARAMDNVKIYGAFALLLAGGSLVWIAWPIVRKLFASLPRHPVTALSVGTLGLLYMAVFLAPFLATNSIEQTNLKQTYHPPSKLIWRDGRIWAQVYRAVDPAQAQYDPEPGRLLPLTWFGEGFQYNLLGFFQSSRARPPPPGETGGFLDKFWVGAHLLTPDYKALEAELGREVDPKEYPFFLLGSDSLGRDTFSRMLYGGRVSLTIGLVGIGITLTMGFVVGGLAGYFGGAFDFWAMRLVEFLMSIPTLYLMLALRAALAPYFEPAEMYLVIIIILSLIGWAGAARVLRGMSLSLRERPFVTAAECLGQSTPKILFRHFLPNLAGYLLVAATLSIPGYVLGEAALSFLGLGIQEPSASWGLMLDQSQKDMKVLMLNFWWMLLPAAGIFATVLSFNFIGDALRDIVDPKMKT